MKTALAVIVMLYLSLDLAAQTARQPAPARPPQPAPQASDPNLSAIVRALQQVSLATTGDLGKLRIDKWKADGSEKQEMQRVAESLQRNITQAVPALISDLQAAPGSVSKAFKLYNNLTVVYEFLSSLSEAAVVYGKKDESDPLLNDASSLEQARKKLSDYIDQSATALEAQVKKATPAKTTPAQTTQGPKKIVIDDSTPVTAKKKKKPSPSTPNQSQ
ncbi:MAG TPA: hypothetical protein VI636_13355 [Candidatus Angelobacter sp.]